MSKEDLIGVVRVINSMIEEEERHKEDAKRDRLFELVSHHVGGIRNLRKLSVLINEMAENYGENAK